MRARSESVLGVVAVMTQDLVTWRVALLLEPAVEATAASPIVIPALLGTAAIDVVNGQEDVLLYPAAGASRTVRLQCRSPPGPVPS